MGVGVHALHFRRQAQRPRRVALALEGGGGDGLDLAGQKATCLRRQCPLERARRIGVHLGAGDAIAARQVLGRADHVDAGGRVLQRLPHEILELDWGAELEAGAVLEGGDGVARHALGPRQQRHVDAVAQVQPGLAEQLEAGAADALYHQRRHVDRHAGVQADVARQHVLKAIAGGHVAGQHGADRLGRHGGALQRRARGVDAQVGGRQAAEGAAVVHHRRARAVQNPAVVEQVEQAARLAQGVAHGKVLVEGVSVGG